MEVPTGIEEEQYVDGKLRVPAETRSEDELRESCPRSLRNRTGRHRRRGTAQVPGATSERNRTGLIETTISMACG